MNLAAKIQNFLKESQEKNLKPLIAILGPTASGKTSLSIEIAKKFDGEIISADSSQVYKHMDIATAKVTKEEMNGIPHYLIDVVDPDEEFSLSDFLDQAKKHIDDMIKRKKVPILAGGTGLYTRALTQNYKIPRIPPNYELRNKLQQEIHEKGEDFVYEKLKKLDPEGAKKIHPRNHRYVVRAIEIATAGVKKEDLQGDPEYNVLKIGIAWPRERLYKRINDRSAIQVKEGLIEETKSLLEKGYESSLRSMHSLGYPEMILYIKGEKSLEDALILLQKNTRNYAKRQLTWLRKEKDVNWISGEKLKEIIAEL